MLTSKPEWTTLFTKEPESTTAFTTETVTYSTPPQYVVHVDSNAKLSSVYTLQAAETTVQPELELNVTTDYPLDKDTSVIELLANAVNSTGASQTNGSSRLGNSDQTEDSDPTGTWISTAIINTTPLPTSVPADLSADSSSHGFSLEVHPSKPEEVEQKFVSGGFPNTMVETTTNYTQTDISTGTVSESYTTAETIVPVELTERPLPVNTSEERGIGTNEVHAPTSLPDAPTSAEIFVVTGSTNQNYSDGQRESRRIEDESSKPVTVNDTQVESDVTSKATPTEPATTIPAQVSPGMQTTTRMPLHVEEFISIATKADSTEPSPTNPSTNFIVPTETNVTSDSAAHISSVEVPDNTTPVYEPDTPAATQSLEVTSDTESKNVSEHIQVHQVSSKSDEYQPSAIEHSQEVTHSNGSKKIFPKTESVETQPFEEKTVQPEPAGEKPLEAETGAEKTAEAKPAGEKTAGAMNAISESDKDKSAEVTSDDATTWLSPETARPSSPLSASLESRDREGSEGNANAVTKVAGGVSRSVECSPEPVLFQGSLRYFVVIGVAACSVGATLLVVTVVLIRLRAEKRRETSPSLQLCGCLGRTHRAEITPRRAEVGPPVSLCQYSSLVDLEQTTN